LTAKINKIYIRLCWQTCLLNSDTQHFIDVFYCASARWLHSTQLQEPIIYPWLHHWSPSRQDSCHYGYPQSCSITPVARLLPKYIMSDIDKLKYKLLHVYVVCFLDMKLGDQNYIKIKYVKRKHTQTCYILV